MNKTLVNVQLVNYISGVGKFPLKRRGSTRSFDCTESVCSQKVADKPPVFYVIEGMVKFLMLGTWRVRSCIIDGPISGLIAVVL